MAGVSLGGMSAGGRSTVSFIVLSVVLRRRSQHGFAAVARLSILWGGRRIAGLAEKLLANLTWQFASEQGSVG
eukprot:6571950-Heterocapsa_arctica.AAC.1